MRSGVLFQERWMRVCAQSKVVFFGLVIYRFFFFTICHILQLFEAPEMAPYLSLQSHSQKLAPENFPSCISLLIKIKDKIANQR